MSKKRKRTLILILSVLLGLFFYSYIHEAITKVDYEDMTYTAFTEALEEGTIEEVEIDLAASKFLVLTEKEETFEVPNPKTEAFKEQLLLADVVVTEIDGRGEQIARQQLFSFLQSFMLIGLLVFALIYFQKKTMGGKNNKAFEVTDKTRVTFDEVAGIEEVRQDMEFLVDFLKTPKEFTKLGAKLPKGVILYGPPGTGKTLTAKAIAGEAGVPFFSVSGSDFVEMFVGLGAKRIRDLFAEARKASPAIIFIDEIDALGSSRDAQQHSEQRQTLNAVLAEMDGFTSGDEIIVIGATNRLNDLDPAFMRPGRFDKHISIGLPDQNARMAIIQVHAKNKTFVPGVDFEQLAKVTIGLSGAHLESVLNEAAIIAVTKKKDAIDQEDLDEAFYKMVMKGHARKNLAERDKEELELVAWHEAGHALAAKLLTKNDVPKVTILSSTSGAGGVTFFTPKKMGLHTKRELLGDIQVLYAGRAAEEVLYGNRDDITTGAQQDIRMATERIRAYITEYGMSDRFGMVNIDMLTGKSGQGNVTEEALAIATQLYNDTLALMTQEKETLKAVADALLAKETLVEEELDAIIGDRP